MIEVITRGGPAGSRCKVVQNGAGHYIHDGYLYVYDEEKRVVATFNKFEWISVMWVGE